jgi:glucosamine-6-phosphate deaminase
MDVCLYPDPAQATRATADWLIEELERPTTKNVMVAGGNTPLMMYADIAGRCPRVSHLNIFALDEYVGVPPEEPRNCTNLLRRSVVEAWNIPADQYYWLTSTEADAERAIEKHEQTISAFGGLDLVILGLGRNGHIGFNEPGSAGDCNGRVVDLDDTSVEANREWFQQRYAPRKGVTTGLRILLQARRALLLAFGSIKARAVAAMLEGPQTSACPASFFQRHHNMRCVLDEPAAADLKTAH